MQATTPTAANRKSLLIASDDDALSGAISEKLKGILPTTLTRGVPTVSEVSDQQVNLLLLDLRNLLDGGHAADRFIEDVQREFPDVKIRLVLDDAAPELIERRMACTAVEAFRGGVRAETIVETLQSECTCETHRSEPQAGSGTASDKMVVEGESRRFETRSPELKRMLEDVMIAAGHDITILLVGETGSGKTYLSNLIHEASPRRNQPFIHVPCGALPRELIESELFGHVKGAFTSAHADKEGKFVAAREGTILLDEIDVLGPEQQVKLLRVIETGEFEPVGSNQTQRSRARLVVASNLDLHPLVEQGKFRPDLYYRLSMLQFVIPPLRKRKADIIPMAKRFTHQFQEKHGIRIHRIEDAVLDALVRYPWPGNVRELEHVIQRAVIYCRNGVLTPQQLPPHILSGDAGPTNDPSVDLGQSPRPDDGTLGQQVAVNERDIIEQTLLRNNFSRTKSAKELGISRVTLYNKMKKYDMLN